MAERSKAAVSKTVIPCKAVSRVRIPLSPPIYNPMQGACRMVKKEYQELLTQIIKKHIPNAKIILFGSRAQNQERPGSDIDLAIDTAIPIPWQTITNVLREIEETIIPASVDIVDLQTCDLTLKNEIQKKGVEWTA